MGRSTYAGDMLIADALDLEFRLPWLWHRVEAGEVRSSYARHVAKRTRDLPADQAAFVDARVAESADGRITWSRFVDLVEAAIIAADPEAAAQREAEAAAEKFARTTRSRVNGMAGMYLRTDICGITRSTRPFPTSPRRSRRSAPLPVSTNAVRWRWWCWPTLRRRFGCWRSTPPGAIAPPT